MEHNRNADGLRGLAALHVALAHFVAAFLPSLLHPTYPDAFAEHVPTTIAEYVFQFPALTLFYNGEFGVLVFFVLSGYVLTIPYYAGQPVKLQGRLWARYLRLNLPIAASIILSFVIATAGGYHNAAASDLSGSTWFHNYFASPPSLMGAAKLAVFEAIARGSGTLNPPLWTLRVEFFGSIYLLAYYLVRPKAWGLLTAGMVCVLLHIGYGRDSLFYIVLIIGSFLGRLSFHPTARTAVVIAGLFFGAFAHGFPAYDLLPAPPFWDKMVFYHAVGAVLLVAGVIKGFGTALFDARPVQTLGRLCYSVYILHFLILASFGAYLYLQFHDDNFQLAVILVCYLCVTLLAATAFERWVDRPSINLAHQFSRWLSGPK